MKKMIFSTVLLFVSLFTVSAGEKTSEDFSSGEMPQGWKGVKGAWEISGGAMSGKELEADHHGAVFMIPDAHTDSSFSCRFQLNGAKGFGLSYNHLKGHLFRVKVNRGGVELSLDKDKKDPASKPMSFGKAEVKIEPGVWYELTCEVKGDTVELECAGEKLSGTHDKLAMEKTGYRFVVAGESVLIDEVSFSSSK
ncbi:MAG: hypothetical protein P1U68_18050 [Verrucomicrobiales bacterium]|nr:hypothetical protein [Verrucomicrobiales bacterium]